MTDDINIFHFQTTLKRLFNNCIELYIELYIKLYVKLLVYFFLKYEEGVCITAIGNILASGNLCFRVFKLQLKVLNKNVCYLYSV